MQLTDAGPELAKDDDQQTSKGSITVEHTDSKRRSSSIIKKRDRFHQLYCSSVSLFIVSTTRSYASRLPPFQSQHITSYSHKPAPMNGPR